MSCSVFARAHARHLARIMRRLPARLVFVLAILALLALEALANDDDDDDDDDLRIGAASPLTSSSSDVVSSYRAFDSGRAMAGKPQLSSSRHSRRLSAGGEDEHTGACASAAVIHGAELTEGRLIAAHDAEDATVRSPRVALYHESMNIIILSTRRGGFFSGVRR